MSEPFDIEAHVRRLTDDGYTVIEDFADAAALAAAVVAVRAGRRGPRPGGPSTAVANPSGGSKG